MCTASTIKSLQLKLLEKMHTLRDPKRKQHPSMEHDVRALAQTLKVFERGCLIMDEVDVSSLQRLQPWTDRATNILVGVAEVLSCTPSECVA